MLVTLSETKQYLRVDTDSEDELITNIIKTAESICRDVARLDETAFEEQSVVTRLAVLYAAAYLYEHREEANHNQLAITLRAMLFGVRKEGF